MKPSKIARKYIEMAVREEIKEARPDYPEGLVDRVVAATMNNLDVKTAVCRAIEIAAGDQQCPQN